MAVECRTNMSSYAVRELSMAEIRGVRPPLWAVRWVVVVVGVAIVIAEMVAQPAYDPMLLGRAPIGSVFYLATGLQITVIALVASSWWIPRVALAGYAILGLLLPLGESEFEVIWWLIAAGSALAWGWLVATEATADRSRDTASGVPPEEIEDGPRLPFVPTAIVAASLAVGIGALVWHAVDAGGVRAFEARADRVTATVVEQDGDDWVLQVGAEQWTFGPPDNFTPEPGMTVGLLVDPLDEQNAVWLAQPDDPSWLIGVAACAPFGLAIGFGRLRCRREADALLRHGGPGRRIVLRQLYAAGYAVFAPSAVGGARFLLAEPDLVYVPPDRPDLPGYWMVGPPTDDDGLDDEDGDDDEDDDVDLSAAPLDPVDLAEWADDLQEVSGLPDDVDPPSGPALMTDVPAVLIGRLVQGGPVLLWLEDGRVYQDTLRIVPNFRSAPGGVEPRGLPAAAARTLDAVDAVRDAAGTVGEAAGKPFRDGSRFMIWVRSHARALRWLVLVEAAALGWAGGWVLEGMVADWHADLFSWLSVLRFLVALAVLVCVPVLSSAWFGGDSIQRDPAGFRTLGWLFDRVVDAGQVVGIAAGRRAVGVQLADRVLSLDPARFHRDAPADVDAAERLIRGWLAAPAQDRGVAAKGGLRPTPGLYGTILIVGWWIVAVVLALGNQSVA